MTEQDVKNFNIFLKQVDKLQNEQHVFTKWLLNEGAKIKSKVGSYEDAKDVWYLWKIQQLNNEVNILKEKIYFSNQTL